MSKATFSGELCGLFSFLDALDGRPQVYEFEAVLKDLAISVEDVAAYVRFSDRQYLRNLVYEGAWYHALAICWRSGQRSPIHNHAGSTCGVRVLTGIATETTFESTPSGHIKATGSRDMLPGSCVVSQDAEIHQLSNLQAAGMDLVTLHVYSPPLRRMDVFSLTSGAVEDFRPMVLEVGMGCGI